MCRWGCSWYPQILLRIVMVCSLNSLEKDWSSAVRELEVSSELEGHMILLRNRKAISNSQLKGLIFSMFCLTMPMKKSISVPRIWKVLIKQDFYNLQTEMSSLVFIHWKIREIKIHKLCLIVITYLNLNNQKNSWNHNLEFASCVFTNFFGTFLWIEKTSNLTCCFLTRKFKA